MQNRHKRFSLPGQLLTLSLILLCARPLAAQKFPIRLERPSRLKEPHHVSYRLVQKANYKILDEHPLLASTNKKGMIFVLELEGKSRIEKTDDSGRVLEKSIRVKRWQPNDELIAEGLQLDLQGKTLIVRENEGPKQFLVDGKPIKGFDQSFLSALFSIDQIGEKGTDKQWGTSKPQKIGGTWPITFDETFFKAFTKHNGITFESEGKGTARLRGKSQASGRDCLSIQLESESKNCFSGELVNGMSIVNSSILRKIQGNLPLDSRLPWQKIEDLKRYVITAKNSEGPLAGIRMRQSFQQQVQREITFPKSQSKN